MTLAIYGAGGLGREVLDIAKTINNTTNTWSRIVFINDSKTESFINGIEVYTFDEFQQTFLPDAAKITIAVGEPKIRQLLREKAETNGYKLQTIIHPIAFIGTQAELGDGVIVQYGSFVSCNVQVHSNVLIQPNANVGHDSSIGHDTIVSSFVAISGNCKIGERVYIGVSVPVKEKLSIGADSIVGMGSVVLRDIPDNVIALGNPARVMKYNESGRVFK